LKSKQVLIEKRYGLPMKEILERLYSEGCYSYKEIATFFDVDCKAVRLWAKKAGIRSRSISEGEVWSRREKRPPQAVLPHLGLCLCLHCEAKERCPDSRVWHERGYCVMACSERR